MSALASDCLSVPAPLGAEAKRFAVGSEPTALADIYESDVNLAIWRRPLSASFRDSLSEFLEQNRSFQISLTVTPESVYDSLMDSLPTTPAAAELGRDVSELVDMFCCLFDLRRAGLRMAVLDRAMCPRFHVDRVPCRLATTYQGTGTQWLPHQVVDRSKLGMGNNGLPDEESGLFQNLDDIQQLNIGDVALLKGELWEGNENAGLVHRSPAVSEGEKRLFLSLDFMG